MGSNLFCGIDVGTSENLGVAIVDDLGEIVEWHLLKPIKGKRPIEEKLRSVDHFVHEFVSIRLHSITMVGIEKPWIDRSKPHVGLNLAFTAGDIFSVFSGYGIQAMFFTPKQVKRAMTGNGSATKGKVLQFAQSMDENIRSQDVADAVATALAARERWKEDNAGRMDGES